MASVQTSSYGGRYLKLTVVEESYSIANNTSTIRWTIESIGGNVDFYSIYSYKVVVNGVVRDGDGSTVSWNSYNFPASKGSKTGTFVITHNSDGSANDVSFELHGKVYYAGDENKTGSIKLTKIPRVSSVKGGTGEIGGKTSINITRASGDFKHTLRYAFGELSGTIATKVDTSYTWTIPASFYSQIPNNNSGTGTIYCDTYYGNTKVGTSSCEFTAKVTNSNPTFEASNISYLDSNTSIVAITGNNQHIVRNLSNLKVTFTSATAKNSATISKYEITFNGSIQTKTSAQTINYGTVNLSSNAKVTIKVTDSRGNSTTIEKTIIILNWELPIAQISAKRVNNYEDETKLKVQVSISSVNSKNSIQSLKYRYKRSGTTTWTNYTNISNNTEYTISLNKIYAWDFQVVINDKFGQKTYNFQVFKGTPILFIDVVLLSVGIDCFPVKSNSLEVNGHDFNDIHPINSIIATADNVNPSAKVGGTWVQLTTQAINGTTIYYWKRTE